MGRDSHKCHGKRAIRCLQVYTTKNQESSCESSKQLKILTEVFPSNLPCRLVSLQRSPCKREPATTTTYLPVELKNSKAPVVQEQANILAKKTTLLREQILKWLNEQRSPVPTTYSTL